MSIKIKSPVSLQPLEVEIITRETLYKGFFHALAIIFIIVSMRVGE